MKVVVLRSASRARVAMSSGARCVTALECDGSDACARRYHAPGATPNAQTQEKAESDYLALTG